MLIRDNVINCLCLALGTIIIKNYNYYGYYYYMYYMGEKFQDSSEFSILMVAFHRKH